MDNLRHCGKMYIKFDQQNNPEYGFVVDDRQVITKFYPLCDRKLEKISLPVFATDAVMSNEEMARSLQAKQKFVKDNQLSAAAQCDDDLITYAKGSVKIASGCFAGIKRLQIAAPVDYSVMLDWGCFDKDSQIELLLPPDMGLKQVGRMFDTGFDYARENWTLIAHQNFNFTSVDSHESYETFDFNPQKSCYQISVKPLPAEKLQTCLIGKHQIAKGIELEDNIRQ